MKKQIGLDLLLQYILGLLIYLNHDVVFIITSPSNMLLTLVKWPCIVYVVYFRHVKPIDWTPFEAVM